MSYAAALGVEPAEVIQATTREEVAEVVARAAEQGRSVIPWGGGTGQTYGYLPKQADILLDLTGLNRVVAHEFADLTITVEGGATLAAVQEALALHNQYLPLDPAHTTQATVGGIIACDAFGPSVVGAGSVRDWMIGIRVVDAQGRFIHGGGKVVKNVTGYDLPKLHVGAMGTLGIVVEATFKVAPRPEATRVGVFTCLNPEFAPRLHNETAPAMSLLRSNPKGTVLAVLYSGLSAVVESEIARAAAIAQASEEIGLSAIPSEMPPPFSDTLPEAPLILQFGGTRADAVERHNAILDLADWQMVDTLPGTGHTEAYLSAQGDPEKALKDCLLWAGSRQTTLLAWHAPAEMRGSGATLWAPLPPALPLMRRLKQTLDPNGILNPGRFVGEM